MRIILQTSAFFWMQERVSLIKRTGLFTYILSLLGVQKETQYDCGIQHFRFCPLSPSFRIELSAEDFSIHLSAYAQLKAPSNCLCMSTSHLLLGLHPYRYPIRSRVGGLLWTSAPRSVNGAAGIIQMWKVSYSSIRRRDSGL